jgi:hypothetical protein
MLTPVDASSSQGNEASTPAWLACAAAPAGVRSIGADWGGSIVFGVFMDDSFVLNGLIY